MLEEEIKRKKEGTITHNKSDVLRNRTLPSSNIQDNKVLLNEKEKKQFLFNDDKRYLKNILVKKKKAEVSDFDN